jgi:hypothetical protein
MKPIDVRLMGEELSPEGYIGKALSFHRSQNINTELYQ